MICKCFPLAVLVLMACGKNAETSDVQVSCPADAGGQRSLRGVCTVDTEHHIGPLNACTFNSGVRRYASTNDPMAVQTECRSLILDVAREFCERFPDEPKWQASWAVFKPSGTTLTGSERMFGECKPLAVQTDEWSMAITF